VKVEFSPPRGAPARGSSSESERGAGGPPWANGGDGTVTAVAAAREATAKLGTPGGPAPRRAGPRRNPARGSRAAARPRGLCPTLLAGASGNAAHLTRLADEDFVGSLRA
jgi:hypothetical protein